MWPPPADDGPDLPCTPRPRVDAVVTHSKLIAVKGSPGEGPLVKTTGQLERGAADTMRPIFEGTLKELGVGRARAELLMRRLAEAYMAGRAHGINVFPHQANRALSAEGIAIALALQYAPEPPPHPRDEGPS